MGCLIITHDPQCVGQICLQKPHSLIETSPNVKQSQAHVRVHLTNVTAPGPAQVVASLLPALEATEGVQIDEIFLPDHGQLAGYSRVTSGRSPRRFRRFVPNALSRALECTLLARRFDGTTPLLVLGDVPLACKGRQVVFVQTAHIVAGVPSATWRDVIKHGVARLLFKWNSSRVSAFIVQTEVMKSLIERACPWTRGKVVVIPQPPPEWLLDSGLQRTARYAPDAAKLSLFYPAAGYAHKNHELLAQIRPADAAAWPVERLTLTIPATAHPDRRIPWIDCVGFLSPREMLRVYGRTDALVFLSTTESYGLPLVEAMHVGLPIVAPDLPYARVLCGDEAVYFDVRRIDSLREAIVELQHRLSTGWWPDWTTRRAGIPENWSTVAHAFLQTVVADL